MNNMIEQESKFDSTKDASDGDLGGANNNNNASSLVRGSGDYATNNNTAGMMGDHNHQPGAKIAEISSATKKSGYDEAWQVDASNSSQSRKREQQILLRMPGSSKGHHHKNKHNNTLQKQTNSNLANLGPTNVHKLRPISPSGKENEEIAAP